MYRISVGSIIVKSEKKNKQQYLFFFIINYPKTQLKKNNFKVKKISKILWL